MPQTYPYDIAISFAGHRREVAASLAERLQALGYAVFYDRDEEHQLWGRNGRAAFAKAFGEDARYCIALISEDYDKNAWTVFEWEVMESREMGDRSNVLLPVMTDHHRPSWLRAPGSTSTSRTGPWTNSSASSRTGCRPRPRRPPAAPPSGGRRPSASAPGSRGRSSWSTPSSPLNAPVTVANTEAYAGPQTGCSTESTPPRRRRLGSAARPRLARRASTASASNSPAPLTCGLSTGRIV